MKDKFLFLTSVRFWNLVIIAVVIVLKKEGIIIDDTLLSTISEIVALVLGGSTVIKTVDRAAEKSGAVDTGAVIAQPQPSDVEVPGDQGVKDPKNELDY